MPVKLKINMALKVFRLKGQKGQSLLEFVLVLPLLMCVLLGLIQFGAGIYAQSVVTGAAQEGARLASEADKGLNDGINQATRIARGGLGSQAGLQVEGTEDGKAVSISVRSIMPTFLPFLDKVLKLEFQARSSMLKEGWKG